MFDHASDRLSAASTRGRPDPFIWGGTLSGGGLVSAFRDKHRSQVLLKCAGSGDQPLDFCAVQLFDPGRRDAHHLSKRPHVVSDSCNIRHYLRGDGGGFLKPDLAEDTESKVAKSEVSQ